MYEILIIKDDKALCNNIKTNISNWGYDTISVENFENILEEFVIRNPHL